MKKSKVGVYWDPMSPFPFMGGHKLKGRNLRLPLANGHPGFSAMKMFDLSGDETDYYSLVMDGKHSVCKLPQVLQHFRRWSQKQCAVKLPWSKKKK